MSHAVPPLEGQYMEREHKREFKVVQGGEPGSILGAEQPAEPYPDFEFDLSENLMIGNGVVEVNPQRRFIRVVNSIADVAPEVLPHITAKHHLMNHLKRELKHSSRNVEAMTEQLRESNNPIAQIFDQLDAKYGDGEKIAPGEMRALKRDVLIIAEHVAATRHLGKTALDTTEQTE